LRALHWGALRPVYALYAAITFLILGLTALVATLVLPGVYRRRAAARACARAFLLVAGMPLTVRGMERLTSGQCVVVANHASYLDGLVFTAALPARFSFVIKREMSAVPLAGLFLRRIGSEFVERFDRNRGAADARRVLRNAASGHSLVFFPEGTFTRTPGLLKFHTGAFVTAARAGCPVIPVVVRGTRAALPPTGGLPQPGRIEIDILPAVHAEPDAGEPSSASLRDHARAAILLALGEPDLTCCGDNAHPPHTAHERSARGSRS
jgi:1-acyl-sn-glycerol-3-phosphate acyltransferase